MHAFSLPRAIHVMQQAGRMQTEWTAHTPSERQDGCLHRFWGLIANGIGAARRAGRCRTCDDVRWFRRLEFITRPWHVL